MPNRIKKKPAPSRPKTHEVGVFFLAHNAKGEYLMVRQNGGLQRDTFPGGKIKQGEKLLQGLVREVLEETGYRIKIISGQPPLILERKDKDYLGIYFFGETEKKPILRPKKEEIQLVNWIKPEQARRKLKNLGPQAKIVLRHLRKKNRPEWNCLQTKKKS